MRHTFTALVFEQNGMKFYLAIGSKDTLPRKVQTDTYGIQNDEGYQRGLNKKRATDYSAHIEHNQSPRSILLNVRTPQRIIVKGKGPVVKITVPDTVFNVDGQHFHSGIGLRKNPALFQTPLIFANVDQDGESELFRVINMTPDPLNAGIAQQIGARHKFIAEHFPPSIRSKNERERPATLVTNALAADLKSVWGNRITLATERHDSAQRWVRQASFVNTLAQNFFRKHKGIPVDDALKMINALWNGAKLAWTKAYDDPDAYMLFSMMGVGILHRLFGAFIFPRLWNSPNRAMLYDPTAYKELLLASQYESSDWIRGRGKVGTQIATKNAVYDKIMKDMIASIERHRPSFLPAPPVVIPKKRGRRKGSKNSINVDLRPQTKKASVGR